MEVVLFGIAKEIAGDRKLIINDADNVHTVSQLKNWMKEKFPAFKNLTSFAVAVDRVYADDEQSLTIQSEIAIIPPVSGG